MGKLLCVGDMHAALQLCACLGWLSPMDVCRLQSTSKAWQRVPISWDNYRQDIIVDMSDASRVGWLQKNIPTIKQLQLIHVEDYQLGPLAAAAALLTSLNLDSNTTGSAGLFNAAFLQHLHHLVTLSIDAPFLTTIAVLPDTLQQLDLCGCSTFQQLPDKLPASLETLNCDDCRELWTLPAQLPSSLQQLKIGFCSRLTQLPELPKSLTYLDFSRCHRLEAMPVLPDGLLYLDMLGCEKLGSSIDCPTLPPNLTYLDMSCYSSWALPDGALPPHLEILKIHFWDSLMMLPQLPSSLKRLSCGYCNLESLEGLPSGLTHLNVGHNDSLLALPDALPLNLEVLRVEDCNELQALPGVLPPGLKVLKASFVQLPALPSLPASLQTLDLSGNTELLTLPNLSITTALQELKLTGCPALDELPHGPPGLKDLRHLTHMVLVDCEELVQLPELPSSLKRLVLRSCSSLEKLPNLPLGLTDLVIGECDELTALPALPESLKELSVDHSPIEQVGILPAGLQRLCYRRCGDLESLPDVLPGHLTDLECSGNLHIAELPALPTSLKRLDCSRCWHLWHLPDMPHHLTQLNCKQCPRLEMLPALPCNLERLNCSGCEALAVVPSLPRSLKYFDCSMCISLRRLPDITGTCMIDLICGGCKELVIGIQQFRTLPPTLRMLDVSGLEKCSMWDP